MLTFQAVRERFTRQRGGGQCRTRVPLPAVLDFPRDVLRALRQLHPMLDGYILPDGRVWLLQLVPNRARIHTGRAELVQMKLEGDRDPAYSAHLMAEGFMLVAEMEYWEGTSAGAAVKRAEQVLHATSAQVERTYRARRAEADSSNAKARMHQTLSDRIRSDAKSDWSRAWRGRH